MKEREKKRQKIAFFGHFDSTNFGNESTLQAVLHHLRCYQPNAKVTCISTGPEAVVAAYQIQAIPISENLVKSWLPRKNPLLRLMRRMFVGIPSEPYRWINGLIRLWGVDLLVIAGTGLLNDSYGLSGWGPYGLFKWSLIAKSCGCKLHFISVGAGPISGALGKWLVKWSLSLADFRSYRDHTTVQYLKCIGFPADDDRVYPDLAFSLPVAVSPRQTETHHRTVVGIGVMSYTGRHGFAALSDASHLPYLENLASVVRWLLGRQSDVRLLIGDLADLDTKKELRALLRKQLWTVDEGHIVDEPILSVQDLLQQIAATDLVVATRFHNIIFALLCEKPVISIAFHHKCRSLMSAMGLSAYCLDMDDLKADILIDKICEMEMNAKELKFLIRERVTEFRDELDEQYRFIFNDIWPRPNAQQRWDFLPRRTR